MSNLSHLDYRNGRYQGQIYNNRPHGIGAYLSINLSLIFGNWKNGQLQGKSLIINPNGNIFCGQIKNNNLNGLCLYQMQTDHIKLYIYSQNQKITKIAAIAPLYKYILEIDFKTSQIIAEYQLKQNEQQNLECVMSILQLPEVWKVEMHKLQNYFIFFKEQFILKYSLFQQMKITSNGYLQHWIGFKEFGLGARIQPNNLKQDRIKTCQAYIIRQIGGMTRENVLKGIGLKCIDHPLKGLSFEEGVFQQNDSRFIIQYKYGDKRPIKCEQIIRNQLKRSLYFKNNYINTQYLNKIIQITDNIKKLLFNEEIIKLAHFSIQNAQYDLKVLTEISAIRIQSFLKSQKLKQDYSNKYNQQIIKPQSPDFNLSTIKKDIYRAIQAKKQTKNSNVNYQKLTSKHPHQDIPLFQTEPLQKSPKKYSKLSPTISKRTSRLTGSITPKKQKSLIKKESQFERSTSKTKIKQIEAQYQSKTIKAFPSPILKQSQKSKSKSNKKVTYIGKNDPSKRIDGKGGKSYIKSGLSLKKPILRQNVFG